MYVSPEWHYFLNKVYSKIQNINDLSYESNK